jgi:zinc/manganese transport system substrate-binding protein
VRVASMNVSHRSRQWGLVAMAAILVGGAVVWSIGSSSTTSSSGVIRAVGAENEYANVIAQLGGRYVHVTAVMSNPATDPHSYEVSTQVAQSIAAADLVVQNGVGYDNFMSQLESAAPDSHRAVINVQSALGLPSSTKNPHLWYSPSTMPLVATSIERALAKLEPKHASYFAKRLRSITRLPRFERSSPVRRWRRQSRWLTTCWLHWVSSISRHFASRRTS